MFNHRSTITKLSPAIVAGVALFAAAPAIALPVGGGDPPPPPNLAPVAVLKASPLVAITSTLPVISQKTLKIGEIPGLYGRGTLVSFDGSDSYDKVDDAKVPVTKYYWDLDGDGDYEISGGADAAEQTKRYFTHGTYHVHLQVRDAENKLSTVKTQDIVVHDAPNAQVVSDIAKPLVGQDVKYDATASTADPNIASVVWDLDGDGTFETDSGTSLAAHASYATPGVRNVKVKITDTYGVTDVATVVEKVNQAPTAAFDASPNPVVGQAVTFDASGSGDDSAIANYAWDLDGDGIFETDTGSTPSASKTYATQGTVSVRLRVTDDLGASSVVTHAVLIGLAPVTTGGKGSTGGGTTGGTTGGTNGGASTGGSQGTLLTDKSAPILKFASRKAKLKGTKVTIKLTCPAAESTCTGKLKLRTTGKRPASLGSVAFTIKGGKAQNVRVLLPAVRRAAIRHAGHLKANAVVTVKDAAGNTGVSTTGILIGL